MTSPLSLPQQTCNLLQPLRRVRSYLSFCLLPICLTCLTFFIIPLFHCVKTAQSSIQSSIHMHPPIPESFPLLFLSPHEPTSSSYPQLLISSNDYQTLHCAHSHCPSDQVLSTASYPQFPPSPSHCFYSVPYQQTRRSIHIQLHDHQQLHSGFCHHSYPSPFSCMTLIHFNFPQAADTIRASTLTSPYIFSHPSPLHYLQGAPHNQ